MNEDKGNQGQAWIRNQVMAQGLCTGCAACVGLCPYQKFYRDQTAVIHECDRTWGRCSAYCPRGQVDLGGLRTILFEPRDITPELGAVKGLYMTRSTDPEIRDRAQHGGTVSTLVALTLKEGFIHKAVLAERKNNQVSESVAISDPDAVASFAGSKFSVAPTVAKFNEISQGEPSKIGVVATPCQALALARMRAYPQPGDEERMKNLALVIGLFCGWALSFRELRRLIKEKAGADRIQGMDIPPSQHKIMELHTEKGLIEIPMEEVQTCIRESCRYCYDLTCEFSDLSVGSARSPEGWAVDRGWNQVLVRTDKGQALLDLARSRGILEFKAVPPENLDRLKAASLGKKNTCMIQLEEVSGRKEDLIYTRREAILCQ
ncbi:coenzyme F420 hydrogenase/dehydrogenase, beta subunit C-terminal domain protein [delta proteobacterium NaphS2]|nr:coenzyme F420 hydrogenase/dehydrogenase, beta subunit C-terminal domain protein [delta proteobacterium NaphS2]